MAHDDDNDFGERAGFADLLSEVGGDSSFSWDAEELEGLEDEATRAMVTFRIGQDYFAVVGSSVREIMGSVEKTDLPGAPEYIRGITVLRRQVVGLLSLRTFLGLAGEDLHILKGREDDTSSTARTLIVETAHHMVGLLVDEVTGLDEWPESALSNSNLPENMHDATRRYARGARRKDKALCVYLDLEALLDDAAIR